jgi:protease-4
VKSFILPLVSLGLAAVLVYGGAVALNRAVEPVGQICDVATVRIYGELYSFVAKDDDVTPRPQMYYGDGPVPSDAAALRSFVSSSDEIVRALEAAEQDDSVRGVIVEVDSPGGSAYAGDAIRTALERLGKPSVAVIKEYGDSAAYWAATGADWIIAAPTSDVGSIGVTGSYVDSSLANEQNGYTYVELTSGPYKDTGSPDKGLTQDEYDYLQGSVDQLFSMFVDAVAESRSLPRDKVLALADGSTMFGRDALRAGLIDEVGGLKEAREYLARELGSPVAVCEAPTLSR